MALIFGDISDTFGHNLLDPQTALSCQIFLYKSIEDSLPTLDLRKAKVDKNNEPKYPEISQIDEEFRDELFEYLNKMVERMVLLGFTPNDSKVVKKITGKAPNLKAQFPVPKGAVPGKKITIQIGGKDIIVKIPDASIDGSGNYW